MFVLTTAKSAAGSATEYAATSALSLPFFLSGITFAGVTQEGEEELRYFVETYQRSLRPVTLLADEQGVLTAGYQVCVFSRSVFLFFLFVWSLRILLFRLFGPDLASPRRRNYRFESSRHRPENIPEEYCVFFFVSDAIGQIPPRTNWRNICLGVVVDATSNMLDCCAVSQSHDLTRARFPCEFRFVPHQGEHRTKTIPHCYIVRGGSEGPGAGAGFGVVEWHGHPARLEAALGYLMDDDEAREDTVEGEGVRT